MEIYVLDKDINVIGVVSTYESLLWTSKFFEPGTFKAQFLFTSEMTRIMQTGNLLYKTDEEEAGVITKQCLKLNKYGEQTIVVQGYMTSRYLYRRIIWEKMLLTGTPEQVMRKMVYEQAIAPKDTARKIPNLELGELKGYEGTLEKQITYDNLQEALTSIAKAEKLGYRLRLDLTEKMFFFDVLQGTDRKLGMDTPCIFSRTFGNVYTQEYSEDIATYKSICLVGGPGEDTERVLATVGEGEGLERHEMFYNSNSMSAEGITQEELIQQLAQKGREKLAQYPRTESFECKINESKAMEYGLGDIVSCMDEEWGVTKSAQVTEIQKGYSKTEKTTLITLGSGVLTLVDLIKAKE